MIVDATVQNYSSALEKRIGFANKRHLTRCIRQLWTTLGRIALDFGERLIDGNG